MSRDPLAPQPPPNPQRSDSHEIVEAIVAAAIEIAHPEVTASAIADRAGVGIASLYRYFPSRAAIFAEISRRLHQRSLQQLRAILAQPGLSLPALADQACRLAIDGLGMAPALRQCLNLLVPASWSQASAEHAFHQMIAELVGWLRVHLDSPPADLEVRVFCLFASCRGVVQMAVAFGDTAPDSEVLVQQMARMALAHITL